MAKKPQEGSSEDLAGLGSILTKMAEREAASKTRDKITAINSRSRQSRWKKEWEKDRADDQSSLAVARSSGHEDQSNSHSSFPLLIPTPRSHSPGSSQQILPNPMRPLTRNEESVYHWLKKHPDVIVQYDDITAATGVKRDTIRRIIARFKAEGWVQTERYTRSAVQGIHITSNFPDQLQEGVVIGSGKTSGNGIGHTSGIESPLDNRKERKNLSNPGSGTTEEIYSQVTSVDEEEFQEQYPNLFEIGFGVSELRRLVESWRKYQIDPRGIFQSLRHADWAVEHKLTDKSGQTIGAGYVFNALKRTGAYDRPKGYESPAERVLRQQKEEKEQQEKLKEELQILEGKNAFQAWLSQLSEVERISTIKEAVRQYPFLEGTKEERILEHYWRLKQTAEESNLSSLA